MSKKRERGMISPRQQRVYQFIKGYITSNGQSPTFAEIGEFFNYSSPATVHRIILILEDEGLIKRRPNVKRLLEIVQP